MTDIRTPDDLLLEARWDDPVASARGVVVLCHPHPLDGGTMTAPLLSAVTTKLTSAGFHVFRFNFRGVGRSEGGWGEGEGEVLDVGAAVDAATAAFPDLPLGLAGWSFGATTSLRWQAESGSTHPWVGIAPGIRSYRGSALPDLSDLRTAPRLIVFGDRDQFTTIAEMRAFAGTVGAEVELLPGSDHFFYFREDSVGGLTVQHFEAALNRGA